jgi:hypothetical protein
LFSLSNQCTDIINIDSNIVIHNDWNRRSGSVRLHHSRPRWYIDRTNKGLRSHQ